MLSNLLERALQRVLVFAGEVHHLVDLGLGDLVAEDAADADALLVDVQRRINMYLRALWARDFFMRPTSGDFETREGYRPYIEDYLLHNRSKGAP